MVFPNPTRTEISHRTIKLVVGVIAISLGMVTSYLAQTPIASISAAYWEDGWSRNFLVGFLFAISAFLLAYNGRSTSEMVCSKVAACAALGVALFPCRCGDHVEIVANVHGLSAATMFLILAYFCYVFFDRARRKGFVQARWRSYIYAICGVTILVAIATLTFDNLSNGFFSSRFARFTFWGESAGLISFGVSWLTASHWLPWITRKDERHSLFSDSDAP